VTRFRKMMFEELEGRNYSKGTIRYYLRFVERFAQHFGKSPDKLGPEHLRSYQAYLLKGTKTLPGIGRTPRLGTASCTYGPVATRRPRRFTFELTNPLFGEISE
jgi:hypothetical protein